MKSCTYVTPEVAQFVQPSAEALRNAILNLVYNQEERRRRSQISVEWARTHFNWERKVEAHLMLYESLRVGGTHGS